MENSIWNSVANIIFPPACVICQRAFASCEWSDALCSSCFLAIAQRKQEYQRYPGIDRWVRYGYYQHEGLRTLIHAFKYNGVRNLAKPLAELQARALEEAGIEGWCKSGLPIITFIPLHPLKQRWRGYNQAYLLAEYLARYFSFPLCSLLMRPYVTPAQASLPSQALRKVNSKGMITLKASPVPPKILLVDDVSTSGATLVNAAKSLRKGGAQRIWAVTVA